MLEEELQRIPPRLARNNSQQLWSIVYMPQVGYVMQISGMLLTGLSCFVLTHVFWSLDLKQTGTYLLSLSDETSVNDNKIDDGPVIPL